MSKPTVLPLWDTDATNITTPSSALLEDGWPDDDIPTAANFNWLFYWVGQWIAWTGNRAKVKALGPHNVQPFTNWTRGNNYYVNSTGIGSAALPLPLEVGD